MPVAAAGGGGSDSGMGVQVRASLRRCASAVLRNTRMTSAEGAQVDDDSILSWPTYLEAYVNTPARPSERERGEA